MAGVVAKYKSPLVPSLKLLIPASKLIDPALLKYKLFSYPPPPPAVVELNVKLPFSLLINAFPSLTCNFDNGVSVPKPILVFVRSNVIPLVEPK